MKRGFTVFEGLVALALISMVIAIFAITIETPYYPTHTQQFQSTQAGIVIPSPTNYVVDNAGVLTPQQTTQINILLANSDNKSKTQIGVLIVNTTQPLTIEQYGIRVAESWKVGYQGVDNGAIIIVAIQDRKVRIEVGDGLQGTLTDIQAEDILQSDMVPLLKKSDWYTAIVAGINGINSN